MKDESRNAYLPWIGRMSVSSYYDLISGKAEKRRKESKKAKEKKRFRNDGAHLKRQKLSLLKAREEL